MIELIQIVVATCGAVICLSLLKLGVEVFTGKVTGYIHLDGTL